MQYDDDLRAIRDTAFLGNRRRRHRCRDGVRKMQPIAAAKPSKAKPLAGVRVIDAGTMVAAPFASVLLADLGADVIKIEHPVHGDGQRKLEPIVDGVPLWWKTISRNKRCITLDLGKPPG